MKTCYFKGIPVKELLSFTHLKLLPIDQFEEDEDGHVFGKGETGYSAISLNHGSKFIFWCTKCFDDKYADGVRVKLRSDGVSVVMCMSCDTVLAHLGSLHRVVFNRGEQI